jgi:hypothetical protein
MTDLVICAIFKNEAPYLYEWLSYHAYVGVKHFFLYDNNSDDNSREVIESWPERDKVTVIDWPHIPGQNAAYRHMIETHRNKDTWCAFIDCDEFLTPQRGGSLREALDWFEPRCNGFLVHWLMFGSSGQVNASPGPVTERFVRRAQTSFPPNNFGKSVVRLNRATEVAFCHIIRCIGDMLNDNGEVIDQLGSGSHTNSSHNLLALNHYYTKSLTEWQKRRSMGKADKTQDASDFRRLEEDFHRHDQNVVEDLTAVRITQLMKPIYYRNVAVLKSTSAAGRQQQRDMTMVTDGPNSTITIDFTSESPPSPYRLHGWSLPEPHGTWTNGNEAAVMIGGLEAGRDYICEMQVMPFLAPPTLTQQVIVVKLAGTQVARAALSADKVIRFPVPAVAIDDTGCTELSFWFPHATVPRSLGLNEDGRKLGFTFRTITLRQADGSEAASAAANDESSQTDVQSPPLAAVQGNSPSLGTKARIAAVTMVYNEPEFLPIWLKHYSRHVGIENCYVIDHGSDDGSTSGLSGCNVIRIPRSPYDPQLQSTFNSKFCSSLLCWYERVLYSDVDEIVLPDPAVATTLMEYCGLPLPDVVTAIGLNIQHVPSIEGRIDLSGPITLQRSWVLPSSSMCKPLLISRDIRWPGGSHSADSVLEFHHLYLFHLRSFDVDSSVQRQNKTRIMAWAEAGQGGHHARLSDDDWMRNFTSLADLPREDPSTFNAGTAPLKDFLDSVEASQKGREFDAYRIDINIWGSCLWRIPQRFKGTF